MRRRDAGPPPDPTTPVTVDRSEPAEARRPRADDIERDRVGPEVGPDEAAVDPRLEH